MGIFVSVRYYAFIAESFQALFAEISTQGRNDAHNYLACLAHKYKFTKIPPTLALDFFRPNR